jgi:uncharacterized protein with PIN domain
VEKAIRSVIGGASPAFGLTELMAALAVSESKLTPEQKAERAEKRQLTSEQRKRKAMVLQSICPNCESKLVRGKKEKKLGYKRLWTCGKCENRYTGDGDCI